MDKQLDVRFDRVEKALGTLVDSIAKYNPSIHYAQDLIAADAELGKGLEERTSRHVPLVNVQTVIDSENRGLYCRSSRVI